MAIVLGGRNVAEVEYLGQWVTTYFRAPTTAEVAAYRAQMVQRKGRKTARQLGEVRMRFGMKVMTGIRDGDFETPGGKKVSSDKSSSDYHQGWKKLLLKYAAVVVEQTGRIAFEGAVAQDYNEFDSDEGDADWYDGDDPDDGVDNGDTTDPLAETA